MRIAPKASIIFILLVVLISTVSAVPGVMSNAAQAVPWQSKVDTWVLETGAEGETEFLVFLTEQADLSGAAALKTKLEKGTFVYQQLTEVAARTQPAVIAALKAQGVQYRPYWVANMIWVRGSLVIVQAMSERGDVAHIYANPKVKADIPAPDPANAAPASPQAIEWNILKVNADDVWAAGFTGQGAVVAGQDTGYDWDHPALKNQYRGWNGASANHNYNWHDAIHSGGGVCGPNSPFPCDDQRHGTHTMGTMVGDDGGSNQIGMAPGARWIGCRNMDQGVGTPTTYTECYQWFIAPTNLNNQNPDPSKAPDVINNSWGCPPSEGCTDPNVLLTVVNNVRAAGILTNHSAGNSGSSCSSVEDPAAIYDASYTVGATTSTDNIASFSSRGPVTVDGSNRLKPDISAPGQSIRSSVPGGGYQGGLSWSGTSMAGPHVAGEVALLISANPGLAGQVDLLENIISSTAVNISLFISPPQTCGGTPHTQIPNNTFGYGRIDAYAAFLPNYHTFAINKSASATEIAPGGTLTYTLEITHLSSTDSTSNVVLTDTLPAGTAFITATLPHTFDGSSVQWDFASMASNETRSVELVVQVSPTARGTVDNNDYGVRSDQAYPVMGAPVSVNIVALEQMLSKTAPATVTPGGMITYTLTVTNPYSSLPIHNLVLTDTIPVNTTFITATLPYSMLGNMVKWDFSSMAASQAQSVALTVQVPQNGTVTNQDYGSVADETEPVSGSPVLTKVLSAHLSLDKTAPVSVQAGDVFTYSLTITNQHPHTVSNNLVLTDTLPASTAFITATLPVTVNGDLVTWTLPVLLPSETWNVQLVVQASTLFAGAIVNDKYGVRSDKVQTVIGPPVTTQVHSLQLNKSATPDFVDIGDLITYTLSVTNQHPLSATHNLLLADMLPADTDYVSSDGSFDPATGVITWTTPSLLPGETWTVQLTVEVLPGAFATIDNIDYSVVSDETPEPLFGEPVYTRLPLFNIFLPQVYKDFGE